MKNQEQTPRRPFSGARGCRFMRSKHNKNVEAPSRWALWSMIWTLKKFGGNPVWPIPCCNLRRTARITPNQIPGIVNTYWQTMGILATTQKPVHMSHVSEHNISIKITYLSSTHWLCRWFSQKSNQVADTTTYLHRVARHMRLFSCLVVISMKKEMNVET